METKQNNYSESGLSQMDNDNKSKDFIVEGSQTEEASVLEERMSSESTEEEKEEKGKVVIRALIVTIIILILLLLLKSCGGCSGNGTGGAADPGSSLEIENSTEWDGNMSDNRPEIANETITVPGYSNLYVSSKNKTIKLVNPKENTVYLQYTISNDSKEICSTKAIKPGDMVEANLWNELDVGEHDLQITISTFDVETEQPCNGAVQEVSIKVEK